MKKNCLFLLFIFICCLVFMISCDKFDKAKISALLNCSENSEANQADTLTTISVSGTGIVEMEADMVSFSINVSEIAPTTGEAQQMTNKKIAQVLLILRMYDIEDKDIHTESLNFSEAYHWQNNDKVVDGQKVSQTLRVKLRNIDYFGQIADDIASNISGISLKSVVFGVQDKSEAVIKARELAYNDALQKAQTYAECSKMTLGKPISVSDGYTSVGSSIDNGNRIFFAKIAEEEVADYYSTEAPSGMLSVTVNANVVFQAR